jgi:hypothetical protein
MSSRRAFLVLALLLAVSAPVGVSVLLRRAPSELPAGPVPPAPPAPAKIVDARPATPGAAPSVEPEPPKEPAPSGWLRVKLELSEPGPLHNIRAVVGRPDGTIEMSESIEPVTQFDLGPLSPGRKALLLFSTSGSLSPITALATIEEGKDTEVILRPEKMAMLKGTLVDASGVVVPEITLEVDERLPLEGFAAPRQPGNLLSYEVETTGRGAGGSRLMVSRGPSSGYNFMMSPEAILLSWQVGTDSAGRFSLPLRPGTAGVRIHLKRGTTVIKEESVVPSPEPIRLVVPLQTEPEKK